LEKIEWWKATFPVELPLYCVVLTSTIEAVYTRLQWLYLFKEKKKWFPLLHFLKKRGVAVDCIAWLYWGKHNRKMAIRGIN